MKTSAIILFVVLAVGMLLLMHYYPYRRIVHLFGLANPLKLLLPFTAMAISFPLAMILARRLDGPIFNSFYLISATWLGLVFFSLAPFFAMNIVEWMGYITSHPLPRPLIGWISIILTLAGGIYGIVNAATVRTTHVRLKIKNLSSPVMVVQLSDIHLGAVYGKRYLGRLVDRINALKPDLVAITGDLCDGSGKLDYEKLHPLENLSAPAFFVTGNHENYEGADRCCELVSRSGVRVLKNELVECCGLQVIGMDTPHPGGGRGKGNHTDHLANMPAIDPSRPAILLYHIPLGRKQAAERGVDLMLCGHTHGGQLFPFTLFMPLAYRHYAGHLHIDGLDIVVSQGAGTWGPPMRIGSVSEIVVIDLVPE